jgi:RNA polymerase sigma-70 factor (ECF subfamily)
VRSFLVFLGCPKSLLDDLVQDVFLSLLSARFEDRGPRATAAFLRQVAHHLFLKTMRRERRNVSLPEPEAAEAAWVSFEGDDNGQGYLTALRECLGRLTGRAREVLRLRYERSVNRTAIAEQLELSEAGVKSILVRARKRLKSCIESRVDATLEA